MIVDSGERREFESGAVRDIQTGKGRCDLLPLDIVSRLMDDDIIRYIHLFIDNDGIECDTYNTTYLYEAIKEFIFKRKWSREEAMLELSKHFEEGALKYSENNWKKGLPINCYIDSALRHYFKWLRGDTDEHHDRAFLWNLMCCIWTINHIPPIKPKEWETI